MRFSHYSQKGVQPSLEPFRSYTQNLDSLVIHLLVAI